MRVISWHILRVVFLICRKLFQCHYCEGVSWEIGYLYPDDASHCLHCLLQLSLLSCTTEHAVDKFNQSINQSINVCAGGCSALPDLTNSCSPLSRVAVVAGRKRPVCVEYYLLRTDSGQQSAGTVGATAPQFVGYRQRYVRVNMLNCWCLSSSTGVMGHLISMTDFVWNIEVRTTNWKYVSLFASIDLLYIQLLTSSFNMLSLGDLAVTFAYATLKTLIELI